MQEIDQRDLELLGILQAGIPLVSTPFAVIGQQIDMSEKEVIKRTERLRREGAIRQVSAQFEPRALGYRSCLVAARAAEDRLDDAAAVVNAHPGVTQNYRRNHEFNLWFTIGVPGNSRLGLERTVEVISREAEFEEVRLLPMVRLFKSSGEVPEHGVEGGEIALEALDATRIEAVRLLQHELPLQPRPFDILAKQSTSIGGDALLAAARELQEAGRMRRLVAVVAPRKAGFIATALAVWSVPDGQAERVAAEMSKNRAVSHCYIRSTHPDWPYNVFTTVQGRSVDECESIINDLAIDTGVTEKRSLFPTREYKRTRLQYFSPDLEEWEEPRLSTLVVAAS